MELRSLGLSPAATGAVAMAIAGLGVMMSLTDASAVTRGHSVAAPAPASAPSPLQIPTPADPHLPAPSLAPSPPAPKPAPSTAQLAADIQALAAASGAQVGVTLVQLGAGAGPQSWALNGAGSFAAASTYKLPLLMAEAQGIAAGTRKSGDVLCYQPQDWEDGWYADYVDGSCYTRLELATRAGRYSDNTAAHILVRELGGGDALNAYAKAHGAQHSSFYDLNTTTSADLAALWADEAAGKAGGAAAQSWLYPLLTRTQFEQGVPAGAARGSVTVHKIGEIDGVVNDAALVQAGPTGAYVLVVCTDGAGGDAGYALISAISARVARYEAAR